MIIGQKKEENTKFSKFFFFFFKKKNPFFMLRSGLFYSFFNCSSHLPIGKNGLCLCAVAHPSSAHPNSVVDLISNSIWTQPIRAHTGQHIFSRLFLYGPNPLGIWLYLKMFLKKFSLLFLKQKKIFKFKIFLTFFFLQMFIRNNFYLWWFIYFYYFLYN